MLLPPAACVTAASEDKNNRSRHELRFLRWVEAEAEALCCAHVRSVVEITRETTALRGKNKGKTSVERIIYLCSLEPDPSRGAEVLERVRRYWDIEGGLHQRLDVSGGEDASRVRNRNAILVLGILRRSVVGLFYDWRRKRKNLRQSTFKDFHDAMNKFNHRLAFATVTSRHP
jgi:predicted transposase YbfD/YdcC